eukprot:676755-Heterocapsa_arctica.AAC.1
MQNYTTLRAGIFRFMTRGRAFGREGQLQGVHGARRGNGGGATDEGQQRQGRRSDHDADWKA